MFPEHKLLVLTHHLEWDLMAYVLLYDWFLTDYFSWSTCIHTGISTLLCYLELHAKHWLVNLPPTYAKCTIQCYGGPSQLQQLAKSCPPVAVAIAKNQSRGKSYRHASSVEFDVVEVARCMGWDLVIVKKELRQLKWRQVLGKG